MNLRERIINHLEERKNKVLSGGINCIPSPFRRFRGDFFGVEQGCYYLVSGATKGGKTQLTNYLFVFNTVLYCYYNKGKVFPKIFYFPLEETQELITLRFMSFLLNYLTKGKIRISVPDLKSTNEHHPIPEEVLNFMNTDETFKGIMELFESVVTFYSERNPTGIFKVLKSYADKNGETFYKTITIKDELGCDIQRQIFDYYKPNNPDEYVMFIVDHGSLIDTERGMTLRESINKLSEYMVVLRNRYNYIPILVMQQSTETQNLEAFKNNKIRPSVVGISDSKYPARDCQIMLGITNPHSHEIAEYQGYSIKRLRGYARFLEVVINRNGVANGICPLLFDGAVCSFKELPLPTEISKLSEVYQYIDSINNKKNTLLFALNKQVDNWFGSNKIKNYLCSLFRKNK